MGEREPWTEAEGGSAREPEAGERGERSVGLRPRIYVASLADYNAGRLHGAWVDAAADPEDVRAAIAGVLGSSGEPGAEEWAIHDYDEFGGIPLGEYESVETVTALARGLVAHGEAFGAYVALVGVAHTEERGFVEHYRGWWQTGRGLRRGPAGRVRSNRSTGGIAGVAAWVRPAAGGGLRPRPGVRRDPHVYGGEWGCLCLRERLSSALRTCGVSE